ncbi:MAG: hypothetical protein Q7T55_18270, partial [Solirubrobacteraceae bacterium]|nr:hypothetical protein [Solirubrobacteraceae bacterium]
VLGVTLVIVGALAWFFGRTLLGKAMLATSHNKLAAQLVGINTRRVLLLSFGLAALLGAFGGILYLNATVITTIFATGKYLKLFGVANILGICLAGWLRWEAVTSVWCIYAAMISGLILLHLQMLEYEKRRGGPSGPAGSHGGTTDRSADPVTA